MTEPLDLIATCAFGLEAIVKRELQALGYDSKPSGPGRVSFRGDSRAICRTNLWLRTADRVLVQMADFEAADFDALFETTRALPWEQWIPVEGEFPVIGRSLKSQLSSVPACQRAVKRAIADRLQKAHQAIDLPETGGLYKVEIALLNDRASLTVDTTGPSLHKRGYRAQIGAAPLKETLAAALVLLSFWRGDRPLIDPFCGSGTIPIEACLIGLNRAPGAKRVFAAETWPAIAAYHWAAARQEARDLATGKIEEAIIGTDTDPRALRIARLSAEAAEVSSLIHFQNKPFQELSSQRKFGCLVTNPPYGQRLGQGSELDSLYQSMPEVLRGLSTWSHFVLTAYPNFEKTVQRQADRRRKLYNGRIECTYYQFHGPRPGPVASDESQVFGGVTKKGREQAELFQRRLEKRARHFRRWPTKQGISCFRVYERDIPEIPLVVDRYEDHLHITEFERPHDRDRATHADWLELMVKTAAETLSIPRQQVFLKRKLPQRGKEQHQSVADQRYEITVNEGGLKFRVNLSDYVDTGLFLDHRVTRSMVQSEATRKRFLNLFAYTGSFTVYAAQGGASETTTVDWSSSYLDWARRNLELNNLAGPQHRFVRSDVVDYVARLPKEPLFDLAVVDPPTFSNRKGHDEDWNVQRDYGNLLNEVLSRMSPGGVLYFSSNFRQFKFDESKVDAAQVHEISRQTVPEDFRNKRVHRCFRLVAR